MLNSIREEQDAFALRSHTNAKAAQDGGNLSDVIEVEGISKDNGIRY